MFITLIILALSIPVCYLVVLLGVKRSFYQPKDRPDDFPFVSIILAARNEEENIQSLCESLSNLSYAITNYEILIADDDSDDNTLSLLNQFMPSNAQIISLSKELTGQYGKIHALRKLTAIAKGDYLLFTDADMTFPKDWIQSMIFTASTQPTILLGLTRVNSETIFGSFQDLDWRLNSLLISWVNHHIGAATAWGNNMMIDRNSYNEIGGFQRLDDTIVEDFSLMNSVVSKGGQILMRADNSAMAITKPMLNFKALISQRTRWMTASKDLSGLLYIILLIRILFMPVSILLVFSSLWWLLLFPAKALMSLWLIRQCHSHSSMSKQFCYLLVFDFYEFVVYLATFVSSLFSDQIDWKGRKYSN